MSKRLTTERCLDLFKDYPKLPKITQNYQKITRYQGLKRVRMGRVIGNFGKLPGNYQVKQGNYPKLPITRVCRGIPYLVIRNQVQHIAKYAGKVDTTNAEIRRQSGGGDVLGVLK